MKKRLLIAALLSGCATVGGGSQAGIPHDTKLSELAPDVKHGVKLGAGPMTVLQAQYQPTRGGGRAELWVARDASCPVAGVGAASEFSPSEAFYGPLQLAEGDYLCASQRDNQSDATLTWVTAVQAIEGGGGNSVKSTITSP